MFLLMEEAGIQHKVRKEGTKYTEKSLCFLKIHKNSVNPPPSCFSRCEILLFCGK